MSTDIFYMFSGEFAHSLVVTLLEIRLYTPHLTNSKNSPK
jgi:hypothetical protein